VTLVALDLFAAFGSALVSSTITILGLSFGAFFSSGASGFFSQFVILHHIHVKKSSMINCSD
jgi:hypothetical protein|tara:strand:+ start:676 stop:861 length:186 start_codon:yes stop_codon:yes gene_type:complete